MYQITFAILSLIVMSAASAELMPGDADRGKRINVTCAACHGTDGNSPTSAFPSIGGQQAEYLLKQMRDIKGGQREVAVMVGMLDNMSDQDLVDLAAFYSEQKAQTGAADPALVTLGERIYRAGIPRKQIAACTACHAPDGQGNGPAKFPMLAGQWPEYTAAQLRLFRTGDRQNDGDSRMMRSIAMDMSDEEIEAVSNYIYGLR